MSALGPAGRVRNTFAGVILMLVTLGLYQHYWTFAVHREMQKHSGVGLGGGWALVASICSCGVVTPFLTSAEVGGLYDRSWTRPPVSAITGFWYFPGCYILIGPVVWFVRTNGSLNDYWRDVHTISGSARALTSSR